MSWGKRIPSPHIPHFWRRLPLAYRARGLKLSLESQNLRQLQVRLVYHRMARGFGMLTLALDGSDRPHHAVLHCLHGGGVVGVTWEMLRESQRG